MTVVVSPFQSEAGFSSPNFLVNNEGNLVATNIFLSGNINLSGDINLGGDVASERIISNAVIINGISLAINVQDTIELNQEIKRSGLEKLGVLEILNVRGDMIIEDDDSTQVLTIREGVVSIVSREVGNIDNISIGLNTPAEAVFTDIEANDIKINNKPTELFHATRKDYVDTKVAALAIALGA
jgi:hypothetical protein